VAYAQTGKWRIEGGENRMVLMPILPLIQIVSFKIFGISLFSARIITFIFFVLILISVYLLVKRFSGIYTALYAVFLLSVNYSLFAYSRLALLDLPMTFFILLSILILSTPNKTTVSIILTAGIFSIAVLTKNTALIAFPILLYIIWNESTNAKRKLIKTLILSSSVFGVFLIYYFAIIKPYIPEFQHFYTDVSLRIHPDFFSIIKALGSGLSMGIIFYPLFIIYITFFFNKIKEGRGKRLFKTAVLWTGIFFLFNFANNYSPPRYYIPILIPMVILISLIWKYLLEKQDMKIWRAFFFILIGASCLINSFNIFNHLTQPKYSLINMAKDIKKEFFLNKHPQPILLGDFADTVRLAVNIPVLTSVRYENLYVSSRAPSYLICRDKLTTYSLQKLKRFYVLKLKKKYRVFDNYYRGTPVLLYKLTPKASLKNNKGNME